MTTRTANTVAIVVMSRSLSSSSLFGSRYRIAARFLALELSSRFPLAVYRKAFELLNLTFARLGGRNSSDDLRALDAL